MKIIVFGFKPDLHAWEFVKPKTSDSNYVLVAEKLSSHSCGRTQMILSRIKMKKNGHFWLASGYFYLKTKY